MANKKGLISEHVLIDKLPSEMVNSIAQNNTSLGDNPALPNIYDVPFLMKIAKKSLSNARDVLLSYKSIDDVDETTIESVLGRLIKNCQEKERPIRNHLEKICFNFVINLFSIPQETMAIKVSLVDKVNIDKPFINLDPSDEDSIEFNDVNDAFKIKKEVYKRRLIDVLCVGCGLSIANNTDSYMDEINKLDNSLCDLYSKIIALNTYLLFEKGNIEMSETEPKIAGISTVTIGQQDEKISLEAEGTIFPILLSETIKGMMETFAIHGLPDDKQMAEAVISKSDYLKAEPWDMRLGQPLWTLLSDSFNDVDFAIIPYLFKRICCLDIDDFNMLFNEVFAKTKRGKQLMFYLCQKAKNDSEYDKFVDKMATMKNDKSIINDEFINEEEL